MPATKRQSFEMLARGLNLAADLDNMPPGDFPYLSNTRVIQTGSLESRPGQSQLSVGAIAGNNPVVSLFCLNDYLVSKIVAQVGSNLYSASSYGASQGVFTLLDSGYGTKPITGVTFKPDQSTHPYLYVANATKMQKFSGTDKAVVGIPPPIFPPTTSLGPIEYKVIADFGGAPWANLGTAGVVTQSHRVSTTIFQTFRVRDGVLISPSSADNSWLAVGARVNINGAEILTVQEVMPAMGSTTVLDVIFWNPASGGSCDVVLTTAIEGITRNSMLLIGGVVCVVDSVVQGTNGQYALRVASTVAFSIAPGQAVVSLCTFLVQTAANYVAGQSITTDQMTTLLTGAGVGSMVLNTTLDLSRISTRPTQPDDYIHISMYVDAASALTSAVLKLDVSGGAFTKDYYQVAIRPSDLQASISGPALAAGDTAITNELIQLAVPSSQISDVYSSGALLSSPLGTLGPGGGWSEVVLRVSDLQRIGTDYTKSLKDVTALQIELTTTGNVNLAVSSWWLGGGYGPDVTPGSITGLIYRARFRSITTGAKSVPGPATRYQLFPKRQQIAMILPITPDVQATHIDIERLDPAVQDTSGTPHWTYVGSAVNNPVGITVPFVDQLSPTEIANNPPLETSVFQPFCTLQPPITGTCKVCGTIVTIVSSSAAISTNILPGTVVLIDGVAYQTYGPGPGSGTLFPTLFELTQSGGSLTNVKFSIDSPVYSGTALPVIFGSMGGSTGLFSFGLGDANNPGTLYWFNGNDMDSADAKNYLEITDPSEPLIGGIVWENYVFVGTQKRLFLIEASFGSINPFTAKQIPAASGFISAWGVDAGQDGIYYVGLDGIYKATPWYGGQMISPELWPLFPHQGEEPQSVSYGNLFPVFMRNVTFLRMCVVGTDIYFNYQDSLGAFKTMRYSLLPTKETVYGWTSLTYANPVISHLLITQNPAVVVPGGSPIPTTIQATSNGLVTFSLGFSDLGTPIQCKVWTPCLNHGDSRTQKLYVDCITDLVGIAQVSLYGNFYETLIAGPMTITGASRSEQRTNIDLSGNLALYLNIGAQYTFSPITQLFEFQPSYYDQPILATNLVTQFLDMGIPGWKISRYGRFELIGTGPVTLKILTSEGSTFTYTLNPGTSLQSIDTQISALCKGRMFAYSLTSDLDKPFALFGAFIKLKRWGDTRFVEVTPFSDALELNQIRKALSTS